MSVGRRSGRGEGGSTRKVVVLNLTGALEGAAKDRAWRQRSPRGCSPSRLVLSDIVRGTSQLDAEATGEARLTAPRSEASAIPLGNGPAMPGVIGRALEQLGGCREEVRGWRGKGRDISTSGGGGITVQQDMYAGNSSPEKGIL